MQHSRNRRVRRLRFTGRCIRGVDPSTYLVTIACRDRVLPSPSRALAPSTDLSAGVATRGCQPGDPVGKGVGAHMAMQRARVLARRTFKRGRLALVAAMGLVATSLVVLP